MFEGNLYIIKNKEVISDGEAKFTLSLLPGSPIYAGHFPDCPITPGVCLLSIIRELTESLRGEKLSLKTVKEAKYVQVVTPETGQIEVYIEEEVKKENIGEGKKENIEEGKNENIEEGKRENKEENKNENKDENKNEIVEVKAEVKSGENLYAKFKLQYERSAAA